MSKLPQSFGKILQRHAASTMQAGERTGAPTLSHTQGAGHRPNVYQPGRATVAPPVQRLQPAQGSVQPKMAHGANPQPKQPTAPAVYRPQPVPKVLQPKLANGHLTPTQPKINSTPLMTSHLSQTQKQPAVAQTRVSVLQPKALDGRIRQVVPALPRQVIQRAAVRRVTSGVVQATKFYPNLHPGAAVPVDRSNIFRLDSFADQYRLHRVNSHAVNVPNQKYNFVRTREGSILLHNRYRHPSLAEGQQVLYAGEVFFNNGNLQWWSNGSGHYQPDADGAEQANLPMDYFYSYQQILKGEHTRK